MCIMVILNYFNMIREAFKSTFLRQSLYSRTSCVHDVTLMDGTPHPEACGLTNTYTLKYESVLTKPLCIHIIKWSLS